MIINWIKKFRSFFRVLLLAIFIVATYSYAMFQGGFVSWFLFYMTTCLIFLVIVYAFVPIGKIDVARKISGRLVAGEDIVIHLTLTRSFPFPFFYFVIEDIFSEDVYLKNESANAKVILYPSFLRKITFSYPIRNIRRGEYQFTTVNIRTSDPFGIFKKQKWIKKEDLFIIYPNYQPLDEWKIYSENVTDAKMTTNHLAKDVTSVAGSREYVPGDRLTAIDWKVTARVNKLMTKEFENQLGQSFLIMLDHTISGKTAMDEIEKAISLSASIIVQASHQQIPIGLMTIADDTKNFPIKIGQDHQLRLIEHLAKLQLPTSFNFDEALLKEINKIEKIQYCLLCKQR
ncbi:MAG: DUF58 domain-containing protein [Bacillaceae bacterium]|nr:DUF58 domain-containing protein [Bacillaceae bacterium]